MKDQTAANPLISGRCVFKQPEPALFSNWRIGFGGVRDDASCAFGCWARSVQVRITNVAGSQWIFAVSLPGQWRNVMPSIATGNFYRRRRLLVVSVAAIATLGIRPALSADNMGQPFELVLPSRLLGGLREAATYPQMKVEGDPNSIDATRGLPLVYIAVGVLLLPDIARALVAVYRDYKFGGVVVETRNGRLLITHDESLSSDTIIVKDAAGKIAVHQNRSGADTGKWVEMLTAAAKK